MKLDLKNSPRTFRVGLEQQIEISDCGTVRLSANEQVTFVTDSGKEYDVAAKDWGFYATPSMNGRLKNQGFKTALVRNSKGQVYIMLVEPEKMDLFQQYLTDDKNEVVEWLDEQPII